MHKSSKKTLPALAREVFAAKIAGAKTANDLMREGFTDEVIAATKTAVEELTQSLEEGVFSAYLRGARKEEDYRSFGYTSQELALVSDRVARRVRDAEGLAA